MTDQEYDLVMSSWLDAIARLRRKRFQVAEQSDNYSRSGGMDNRYYEGALSSYDDAILVVEEMRAAVAFNLAEDKS